MAISSYRRVYLYADICKRLAIRNCRLHQKTKNLKLWKINGVILYGELDETSLYVMRRHYDLKDIYGDAPEVVQSCREYFNRNLKVIEDTLSAQEAICGSDFSLADIILVTCLDWALAYKFELPVNTYEYHNKMIKREAYKKAVQINYK